MLNSHRLQYAKSNTASPPLVQPLGTHIRNLDPFDSWYPIRRGHGLGCECISRTHQEDDSNCTVSCRVRFGKYHIATAVQAAMEGERDLLPIPQHNFLHTKLILQPRYKPTWIIILVVSATSNPPDTFNAENKKPTT